VSRVAQTVQNIVSTGLAPTYGAAHDEMSAPNDGNVFLHVKNVNAAARTLTVVTPGTVYGLAIADLTVTIPGTTGDKMIGPFPPSVFNQADGSIYFNIDVITDGTIAVVRMA